MPQIATRNEGGARWQAARPPRAPRWPRRTRSSIASDRDCTMAGGYLGSPQGGSSNKGSFTRLLHSMLRRAAGHRGSTRGYASRQAVHATRGTWEATCSRHDLSPTLPAIKSCRTASERVPYNLPRLVTRLGASHRQELQPSVASVSAVSRLLGTALVSWRSEWNGEPDAKGHADWGSACVAAHM